MTGALTVLLLTLQMAQSTTYMKKNNPEIGLCTAGAEDPNTAPEATKVIRDSATQIVTCIASMVDYLEEPLKSKFLEVKQQINTMLAALPETDKVPAALHSNDILRQLLSVMTVSQSMISHLASVAATSRKELETARASMTTEIDNALKAKIDAGELVQKDVVDQRINEAKAALVAEQKLISDRRTALATASLPIPADEDLKGEEQEFAARQARAQARAEKLKGFNLSSTRVTPLLWSASDDEFEGTVALLIEATPKSAPAKGANGFIAPTTPTAADLRAKVGLC